MAGGGAASGAQTRGAKRDSNGEFYAFSVAVVAHVSFGAGVTFAAVGLGAVTELAELA